MGNEEETFRHKATAGRARRHLIDNEALCLESVTITSTATGWSVVVEVDESQGSAFAWYDAGYVRAVLNLLKEQEAP